MCFKKLLLTLCIIVWSAATSPAMVGPSLRFDSQPVRCDFWRDVPGAQITDTLTTNDLQRPADGSRMLRSMEFAPGFTDEWACSMSAVITAPVSGRYFFFIASRDSGLLFLSTDETPQHRRFIAETPAGTDLHSYHYYASQTSDPIELVAGKAYFIEALCKSGSGSNSGPASGPGSGPGGLSIGWMPVSKTFQAPIPAMYMRPYKGVVTPPDLRVHDVMVSLKAPATQPVTAQAVTTQPAQLAGLHPYVRGAHFQVDGREDDLSYLMFMPRIADTTRDSLPMMVFLHGNSRQGYSLQAIEQSSPIRTIERDPQLRDWLPMIVLCPQLPPDWRWDTPGAAAVINRLVEQLCRQNPRIDRHRIYLTGLSMGGKGTWLTVENSPQTYAAVAPFSAVDVRPDIAPELLKNLGNLHIVCGGDDGGFTAGSKRMYAALKPVLGDRVQLTVFEHEGHNVWDHYYSTRGFYEELLRFSK